MAYTEQDRARDWLADCVVWRDQRPEPAPVYYEGAEQDIAAAGAVYQYFSPMRPLSFVYIKGVILTKSTQLHHDFMFMAEPLPLERIVAWELVPWSQQATEAARRAAGVETE